MYLILIDLVSNDFEAGKSITLGLDYKFDPILEDQILQIYI